MSQLMKTISLAALVALAWPMGVQAQETDATGESGAAPSETSTTPDAQSDDAGTGGAAQDSSDASAEGVAGDLSMGEEVEPENQVGRTYTSGEHGDWQQRCIRTESGADPCQLYQLLRDDNGNAVAEISVFPLPEGQQASAGATVITPLETLLTRQLTMSVDGNQAKRYPFDFCAEAGCFARIGFTDADVTAFRRGVEAVLTIVPAAAPDQTIDLSVSLSGFTAGYDAVRDANAGSSAPTPTQP